MPTLSRRELLGGALVAGAGAAVARIALAQGVPLGELQEPLDVDELRERLQAGDPVNLEALRASRWSRERARTYMDQFGVVRGLGAASSTRLGSVWGEWNETQRTRYFGGGTRARIQYPDQDFKEQVIEEELGWAADIFHMNSVRIGLPASLYQTDRDRLFNIFERFLDIAGSKGISVMPTLGMGLRDPALPPPSPPDPNPEWDYLPGVWGGGGIRQRGGNPPATEGTLQGFDALLERWPRVKPLIKEYQQTMLSRYSGDERIILWDLLNEPQTWQRPAVEYLFEWAREVSPTQPCSVCWNGHDLSDVITFHTYTQPGMYAPESAPGRVDFLAELDWARAWGRPMLCTEWLARPFGNRFENVLPYFSRYRVGWYAQGLVAGGASQIQYPWVWPVFSPEPAEWFHGLVYPDGRPYRYEEVVLIRDFTYQDPPPFVNTQQYFAYGDDIRSERPALP